MAALAAACLILAAWMALLVLAGLASGERL